MPKEDEPNLNVKELSIKEREQRRIKDLNNPIIPKESQYLNRIIKKDNKSYLPDSYRRFLEEHGVLPSQKEEKNTYFDQLFTAALSTSREVGIAFFGV